jgi:hypothetical protein
MERIREAQAEIAKINPAMAEKISKRIELAEERREKMRTLRVD